jgi:hypothetical protein
MAKNEVIFMKFLVRSLREAKIYHTNEISKKLFHDVAGLLL